MWITYEEWDEKENLDRPSLNEQLGQQQRGTLGLWGTRQKTPTDASLQNDDKEKNDE